MYLLLLLFFAALVETVPVEAVQLEACGSLETLEGDSCANVKAKLNLTSCHEKGLALVQPKVQCQGDEVVLTYRSPVANYRAVAERTTPKWGRTSSVAKGRVWRHVRTILAQTDHDTRVVASSGARVEPVKVVTPPPAVVVIAAPKQTIPEAPAAPLAPAFKKVSDEDVALVVNALSGLSFKGSVDGYYAYNTNRSRVPSATPTASSSQAANKYHVFDLYNDDFQLSYAHLQVQKVTGPVTTTLDFGYGPAMQAISGTRTDSGQINLKQAVIGYKPIQKLNIEAGRFVTYLGLETIEAQDNLNYSRGILFGYFVPFWHQGVKATYTFNEKWALMAMIADNWNASYQDVKQKDYGLQLAYTPNDRLSFLLSAITGAEMTPTNVDVARPLAVRTVYDLVASYQLSPKWKLAFNSDQYNFAGNNAFGAALYAKYQFTQRYSLAPRIEYVRDQDNVVLGETATAFPAGQTLATYTLTFEDKLTEHLLGRAEVRFDRSSENVFTSDGDVKSSQTVALISAVAYF